MGDEALSSADVPFHTCFLKLFDTCFTSLLLPLLTFISAVIITVFIYFQTIILRWIRELLVESL